MTSHLDIGCGFTPRNPYGRDELFGVDLAGAASDSGPIRRANLALHPIPFGDNCFDSVSAYDFLEHVPRVLPTADGQATRFPFIELMDEVWRVLLPGGLFYAVTPVYPSRAAFQDPTHVNIITTGTHTYFTQPERLGAMYGYRGNFVLRRRPHLVKTMAGLDYAPVPQGLSGRLKVAHRNWRASRGSSAHIVWEFEAVKP